jgi:hypothetical protein
MSDLYEDKTLGKAMEDVLEQYEVSIVEAAKLCKLKEYDLIVIADDSGSMNTKDAGDKGDMSRWSELGATLKLIVSLGCCFDEDGIDIYFLNREKITQVKSADDERLIAALEKDPRGTTPLTKTLAHVVRDREDAVKATPALAEKPVLLLLFTDGVPDGNPRGSANGAQKFGETLRGVLQGNTTQLKFHCQLFACTGQEKDIAWARKLDDDLKELDMCDDYITEKRYMDKTEAYTKFTRGDWCMKAMLGAIDPTFDDPATAGRAATRQAAKSNDSMKDLFKMLVIMLILAGVYYVHSSVTKLKNEL